MALTKVDPRMLQNVTNQGRPFQTTEEITITVGTDTTTVQEALNQIPLHLYHNVAIIIPAGSTYENEEIIVPQYYSATLNPTLTDPRIDGGELVIRSSDIATPTYAKIGSIMYSGGVGRGNIAYLHTTKEHSQSDYAAFEVRGSLAISVNGFKADASNDTAPINRCFSAYEGGNIIIKGPVDFGVNQFTHAIVPKRGSFISLHGYDADLNVVNMTGTVDYVMWPQGGEALYSRGAQPTGSVLTYNERISKGGEGIAASWSREYPSTDSLVIENAEKTFHYSFSHHLSTAETIAATSSHTVGKVSVDVPAGQVLVLKRATTLFSSGSLFGQINRLGALSDYTFPENDMQYFEEKPNVIIADNSTGSSKLTGTVVIQIYNENAASRDIQQGDTMLLEFAFTAKNLKEQTI